MVRWAESLTAVVWVATEMGFKSQPGAGVEDLVLSQLRLGFNPWPRNLHMLWAQPKQKTKTKSKTNKKTTKILEFPCGTAD